MDSSIKIQKDIRDNATEVASFLSDLHKWEKDAKEKDKQLREHDVPNARKSPVPIRNSSTVQLHAQVLPTKRKGNVDDSDSDTEEIVTKAARELDKKISAADHTYDKGYKRWEQFDVDSALKEVNGNAKQKKTVEKKLDSKKKAVDHKDKGNQHFQKRMYHDAIKEYSKCIGLYPEYPIAWANRAMAYLKIGNYTLAEKDCSKCLELDPEYKKALLRRGTARNFLFQPRLALQDFEEVLKLEPANSQARREVSELKKRLKTKKMKFSFDSLSKSETLQTPEKTREARHPPKPHRRRMIIDEISDSSSNEWSDEEDQKQLAENSELEFKEPSNSPRNTFKSKNPTQNSVKRMKYNEKRSQQIPVTTSQSTMDSGSYAEKEHPVPRNFTQFNKTWNSLKKHPDARSRYLKRINPSSLPKLIKSNLDGDQLTELIDAINDFSQYDHELCYKFLHALTNIERFYMVVMFLDDDIRRVTSNVLSTLEKLRYRSTQTYGEADIERLKKCYEVS